MLAASQVGGKNLDLIVTDGGAGLAAALNLPLKDVTICAILPLAGFAFMHEERTKSRRAVWVVAGVALVVALVWAGTAWGQLSGIPEISGIGAKLTSGTVDPLWELL